MLNNIFSVGLLQSNGIKIETKQYFVGIPDDFESFLRKTRKTIDEKTNLEKSYIEKNFKLKLDPRFFDFFGLKEVPVLALANCNALIPSIEKCEFKYVIRGDVSLLTFFDKIIEEDKSYQKYHDVLIANKILTEGTNK